MNIGNNNRSIAEFISPEQLPGLLHDIAMVVGVEAALIISDEFGGNTIYLAKWHEGKKEYTTVISQLINGIGADAARLLCQLYGGTHLTIPSCKNLIIKMRNQAICGEVKRGVKQRDLVRKYGISDRQIRNIISAGAKQPSTKN